MTPFTNKIFSKFKPSHLNPILAASGTVADVMGAVGVGLDYFQNPISRWSLWASGLCLFGWAILNRRTSRGSFLDAGGVPFTVTDPYRPIYYTACIASLTVLLFDIYITTSRSPIKSPGFSKIVGTSYGYTPNQTDNPLLVEGIINVMSTRNAEAQVEAPFAGMMTSTLLQREKGTQTVLLHRYILEIVRFEEMPTFFATPSAGAGFSEVLKAAFLVKKESTPLPWDFESTHVSFESKGEAFIADRPLVISDDIPLTLQYYISAADPGIYWFNLYVEAGIDITKPKRVKLTDKPMVVAFYQDDTATKEVKSTLDQLNQELHWLTTKKMLMFPPSKYVNDENQIQNLRRQIQQIEKRK
jgi:hypothetical protein